MDHHVYLYRADDLVSSLVPKEYHLQSTDVSHIVADNFGIDDARRLSAQSFQTGVLKERVFVLIVKDLTVQAQNALLKLFEEPPQSVYFHLVISKGANLIPTLLSRVMLVEDFANTNNSFDAFNEFEKMSYADRLEVIAKKTKDKDLTWVDQVVDGALSYAKKTDDTLVKKSILMVSQYKNYPGASKKMLLEEIALSINA